MALLLGCPLSTGGDSCRAVGGGMREESRGHQWSRGDVCQVRAGPGMRAAPGWGRGRRTWLRVPPATERLSQEAVSLSGTGCPAIGDVRGQSLVGEAGPFEQCATPV